MLVTDASAAPVYTVTRDLAATYAVNTNPVWKKGTAIVSMGVGTGTKTGFILIDSSSTNSPYIDIYGRNSNTYSDYTIHGRFGWLKGITDADVGLNNTDVWGLYTDNGYFKGTIYGSTITSGIFQTAASGVRLKIYPINPDEPIMKFYRTDDTVSLSISATGLVKTLGSAEDTSFFNCVGGSTTGTANLGALRLDGNQTGLKIYSSNQTRTAGQYLYLLSSGATADSSSLLKLSGDSVHTGKLIEVSYTGTGRIYDDSNNNVFINKRGYIRQYSLVFEDDFMEASAALASTVWSKAHWTGSGTNGTQTITASVEGGQIQLDTTGTANSTSVLSFTNKIFKFTREPILDWGFRLDANTLANQKIEMGWYVDTNDCLMFRIKPNDANLYLVTENNNAGEVETDTLNDIAVQTWYNLRIEMITPTTFKIYLNNQEILSSHSNNTVRDMDPFFPRFYIDNQANADNRYLSLDFVRVYQQRAY